MGTGHRARWAAEDATAVSAGARGIPEELQTLRNLIAETPAGEWDGSGVLEDEDVNRIMNAVAAVARAAYGRGRDDQAAGNDIPEEYL